jgi:tRNA/tmRNA/rRNA uracil-C5-methylase (TrmA/RlmC/RlmD family)
MCGLDGVGARGQTAPVLEAETAETAPDVGGPDAAPNEGGLPTPARPVEPRCPLFGRCGGCQLQHVPYGEQVAWKTTEVRRLLTSALPDDAIDIAPCIASPREYGYRSKITPHFPRPKHNQVPPIGFLQIGFKQRVIDVEACALATDAINARLTEVRADVASHLGRYKKGASLLLRDATSGVTTDFRAKVTEVVNDLTLNFLAADFFQNNPFLLPRLAAHVAGEARAGGARFLVDAYCGSGLLALTAAPGFERVVGVEVSPSSVKWARENAATNGRDNCTFTASDATRIFGDLPEDFRGVDSAVIVDPPRKGCSPEFLEQLVAFAPRTIVYVSCNPETQVRDLAVLRAAGWVVTKVQPFDMFPQTRHLECVATLARA